jgi:UPF0755 protein
MMAAYLRMLPLELEPGPHLVNDRLSPRELVQRLARVPSRPAARVTLPEGWNHVQIGLRLEKLEVCSRASFERAARDPALLQELGIAASSAEGYLFPATYELGVDSEPAAVVRAMVRELDKRLDRVTRQHGPALERLTNDLGWSRHEVLTLASMVEKEAAHPEERSLVASVFFNRLSDPEFLPAQTLQSDPTSGYGCVVEPEAAPSCAGFDGRITPAMNRDPLNRYSTYVHAGLPPGPIANPGEASIAAVLAPADSEYLFFFADGNGRHSFSRTFDEHRAAIRKRRR